MLKRCFKLHPKIKRSFADKPLTKAPKTSPQTANSSKNQASEIPKEPSKLQIEKFKFTNSIPNLNDFLKQNGKIDEIVDLNYREFPSHISHLNKDSPDYIESEVADRRLLASISSYNEIIDRLKTDLKLHKEYQESIQEIERSSHGHLEIGNTKNVYNHVKDYSFPVKQQAFDYNIENQKSLKVLENENMVINNTPFNSKVQKPSNILEWEKELENLPVTSHFHGGKGHKYDVEVEWAQRHKHVADRLGHPEIFPTPFETIMRLERPLCHPGFLDQPFIQIPSAEPDLDIDFSLGEVIYENPRVQEWTKFWIGNLLVGVSYFGIWTPFCQMIKSSTPPRFIRDEILMPYGDLSMYSFDTYQLAPPIIAGILFFFVLGGLVK